MLNCNPANLPSLGAEIDLAVPVLSKLVKEQVLIPIAVLLVVIM